MINVGDTLQIGGRNATVCYTTEYEGINYICVAFEEDKIEYDLYKYKYDNEKLLVSNEIGEEEAKKVMEVFIKEGLDEYGLPEELESILDKIDENE